MFLLHRLHRPAESPTPLVAVLVALMGILVACGGAERPSLVAPEVAPADELSRQSGESSGDTTEATDGVDPASAASDTSASDDSPAATGGAITDPYAINGEVQPVEGDIKAIVTPTGVVAAVLGRSDDAFVIETPCGFEAGIPWGQPLSAVDVVLDPGHGGEEEGAVAASGLTEAAINLTVARRTAALLAESGVTVALTRTADYRMPITQRAGLADALEAQALVSIHHNSPEAAESTVPGTEVYVQSTSVEARRLGGLVYERVIAQLAQFDVSWVARSDAGVLNVLNDEGEDAYGINRRPATPSALIEVGYLANPDEAALFATEEYVAAVSEAMADGIVAFLTTTDPGSGFVATPREFNPSSATGGQSDCVDPALN